VNATAQTPVGTVVPLTVVKAHALPATGSLEAIDVAVGTMTAAQCSPDRGHDSIQTTRLSGRMLVTRTAARSALPTNRP
jgi:hypothetical protein